MDTGAQSDAANAEKEMSVAFWVKVANIAMLSFQQKKHGGSVTGMAGNIMHDYSAPRLHAEIFLACFRSTARDEHERPRAARIGV